MAAATTAVSSVQRRGRTKSHKLGAGSVSREDVKKRDYISYHLALMLGHEFQLPTGKTSVGVLRSPFRACDPDISLPHADCMTWKRNLPVVENLAGSQLELQVLMRTIQDKQESPEDPSLHVLVVTNKRIFILSAKNEAYSTTGESQTICADSDLEIEDSIPMQEIVQVEFDGSTVKIITEPEGFNRGSAYQLFLNNGHYSFLPAQGPLQQKHNLDDGDIRFVHAKLSQWCRRYRQMFYVRKKFYTFQDFLQRIWQSRRFNFLVLILISSNFCFTVEELQNKDPSKESLYENADVVFTVFFTLDGWSLFDLLVVGSSVALLLFPDSGASNSAVKQMRILRVFRLIRVVSKVGDLKKIVTALTLSIIPTLQSLLIGLVVIFIYAVMGMHFFGDRSPLNFGSFSRAVVSLVGLLTTLEAWPNDTLPIFIVSNSSQTSSVPEDFSTTNSELDYGVAAYSITFTVISLLVLVQVVVAVLLDKFLEVKRTLNDEELLSTESMEHPFDFLLRDIAGKFEDGANLDKLLEDVFNVLDGQQKQKLSFENLKKGIASYSETRANQSGAGLHKNPPVAPLTQAYFRKGRPGEKLAVGEEIDLKEFKQLLRAELRRYLQRNLRIAELGEPHVEVKSVLQAMRIVMTEVHELREQQSVMMREIYKLVEHQCGSAQPRAGVSSVLASPQSRASDGEYLAVGSSKKSSMTWVPSNGASDESMMMKPIEQPSSTTKTVIPELDVSGLASPRAASALPRRASNGSSTVGRSFRRYQHAVQGLVAGGIAPQQQLVHDSFKGGVGTEVASVDPVADASDPSIVHEPRRIRLPTRGFSSRTGSSLHGNGLHSASSKPPQGHGNGDTSDGDPIRDKARIELGGSSSMVWDGNRRFNGGVGGLTNSATPPKPPDETPVPRAGRTIPIRGRHRGAEELTDGFTTRSSPNLASGAAVGQEGNRMHPKDHTPPLVWPAQAPTRVAAAQLSTPDLRRAAAPMALSKDGAAKVGWSTRPAANAPVPIAQTPLAQISSWFNLLPI